MALRQDAFVVGGLGQRKDRWRRPAGIDRDGAERVAEEVAAEPCLGGKFGLRVAPDVESGRERRGHLDRNKGRVSDGLHGVNPGVQQAVLDAAAEVRLLPPLSREEVAQVVEKIAGTDDPDLIDEIAVASESWPGPVERLTRAVVSQRSAQLVAAAAAEAGPASRALTAARSGVAAGVRRLTRVRAWPADEPTE